MQRKNAKDVSQECHVVLQYTKENYTNKNCVPSEDIIIQEQQTVVYKPNIILNLRNKSVKYCRPTNLFLVRHVTIKI
jgi:hypothetical protein